MPDPIQRHEQAGEPEQNQQPIDAEDYHRLERALRASEENLRLALEGGGMGSWIWDLQANRTEADPKCLALFGLSSEEFTGDSEQLFARVRPEDHQAAMVEAENAIKDRRSLRTEFRVDLPSGEVRWLVGVGRTEYSVKGVPVEIHGITFDITERKEADRALQELATRLLNLQEEERRRISRELHEETAQNLSLLNINLSYLKGNGTNPTEKMAQILEECESLIERSLSQVRTLSYLLHPPLLNDAGLVPALRWLTDGFSSRSGIDVKLECDESIGRLSDEMEAALYSVVQESLTNVHRHSNSKWANVRLARSESAIVLRIEDGGSGSPSDLIHDTGGFDRLGIGIPGMKQRLREFGGRLEIETGQNGTIVTATLPAESCSRSRDVDIT